LDADYPATGLLFHAAQHLGINRRRDGDLREMVRPLELWRWFNTAEDEHRLAAAKWALANWHEYQIECNRRRKGGAR
jgi:hypothetical protein